MFPITTPFGLELSKKEKKRLIVFRHEAVLRLLSFFHFFFKGRLALKKILGSPN